MSALTPFSQRKVLRDVTLPLRRNGVCVALCDHWLSFMKSNTMRTPEGRMAELGKQLDAIVLYQNNYEALRKQKGRVEARKASGQTLDHNFEDQTTLMPALIGMDGVQARMMADLGKIGAAVTWTMAFPAGQGRHAIAGYRGLVSITNNVHMASLHIFDPNTGEYVGQLEQLQTMLQDLFRRNPIYRRIVELTRTTTS